MAVVEQVLPCLRLVLTPPALCRYRRQWEQNSRVSGIVSEFSCNVQDVKRLQAPALASISATTPLHCLQNTTPGSSYVQLSTPPVSSSTSYSAKMISTPPESSSISYSSRLSLYHPRRCYLHRHRTRRVLLDIIHTAGILIDIVLVATYLISSTPLLSSSISNSSRLT